MAVNPTPISDALAVQIAEIRTLEIAEGGGDPFSSDFSADFGLNVSMQQIISKLGTLLWPILHH